MSEIYYTVPELDDVPGVKELGVGIGSLVEVRSLPKIGDQFSEHEALFELAVFDENYSQVLITLPIWAPNELVVTDVLVQELDFLEVGQAVLGGSEEVAQAEPDDHQAKKMEVEASGSCYLDRENVDMYLNALFSSQKAKLGELKKTIKEKNAKDEQLSKQKIEKSLSKYLDQLSLLQKAQMNPQIELDGGLPLSWDPTLYIGSAQLTKPIKGTLPFFDNFRINSLQISSAKSATNAIDHAISLVARLGLGKVAKSVAVTAVSFAEFGTHFSRLNSLDASHEITVISSKKAFDEYYQRLEKDIQSRASKISSSFTSFFDYKQGQKSQDFPLHIILVDCEGDLDEETLQHIEKLAGASNLSRLGIAVVSVAEDNGTEVSHNEVLRIDGDGRTVGSGIERQSKLEPVCDLDPVRIEPYTDAELEKISGIILNTKLPVETKKLFEELAVGKGSTIDGLKVPVARSSEGDIYFDLSVDSGNYNSLVGGGVGSGKSVLLHNIIVGACKIYPPSELELVLLDFKEGTEFQAYKDMPHTRILSLDSSVVYGVKVLEWLQNQIENRAALFKDTGTSDLKAYREKTGDALPRILCVIDEFQRLYSSDNSGSVERLVDDIIRRGRSFGIHFLFATQSLYDINLSTATSSNLSLRICLRVSEMDAGKILSPENTLPAFFEEPGRAIFNSNNGLPGFNVEGIIPFLTRSEIADAIVEFSSVFQTLEPKFVYSGEGYCTAPLLDQGERLVMGSSQSVEPMLFTLDFADLQNGIFVEESLSEKYKTVVESFAQYCTAKLKNQIVVLDFSTPKNRVDRKEKEQALTETLEALPSIPTPAIVLLTGIKNSAFLRVGLNQDTFEKEGTKQLELLSTFLSGENRSKIGLVYVAPTLNDVDYIDTLFQELSLEPQIETNFFSTQIYLKNSPELELYGLDLNAFQMLVKDQEGSMQIVQIRGDNP